ncbi:MAG TPA: glycosyltransferase 87 family protein [Nocardioidaceae bacterium]|nr:glycosyltransferase 87 family protein [Nocardioidaceae bacterium]
MRRYWPVAFVLAWLAGRALVVWLLNGRHDWVDGDLRYFAHSLTALPDTGLAHTLVEYPLPGVLVVAGPWLLAELVGIPDRYSEAVLVLSLLGDAAFTVLLARMARPGRKAALVVWLLAVPLLGATTYARFDLVPGLLAGAALLFLGSRPRVAATLAALATGFKLWPAFVLPALAAPERSRRPVVTVVVVAGVLLAGVSVVLAGWERLISPLTWQAERGLQIEAVAATPAMVGWAVAPERYEIAFTRHNAYEVLGPGTGGLVTASGISSLMAIAVLLGLWFLAFRHGRGLTPETVSWLALAAVGLFVVTSKVLSPQYLLWLLPLAAAAAGLSRRRALVVWAAGLLVVTAATQVVFPELYGELTHRGEHAGWAVLVLSVRNVLLVGLVGWAVVASARGISAAGRSSASRPDRAGTSTAPAGEVPPTRR